MAFSLRLSQQLTKARWKVKIFDKENREPPHVTIVRGTERWRINLRTRQFMDLEPSQKKVDDEVISAIRVNWERLKKEWDQIHPNNPVESADDDNA
jgi:hypothetical protein